MLPSRYEWMIARRYLLPGRGEAFITVVASFSLIAVMLGVAALVVVMSVLNGFRGELFDKITGLNGHAVIQGYNNRLDDWRDIAAQARATPGVTSATPLIEQPLFASFQGRVEAALVRGMTMQDIHDNKALKAKQILGSLDALKPGSEQVALGSRLAEQLGATVGSTISILNPAGSSTPFGTMPRIVTYKVAAIFEIGIWDYDKALIVMPMQDAQTLLLMGDSVEMVEVNTTEPDRVGQILAPLKPRVAPYGQIVDWRQLNSQLFDALAMDRLMSFVLLSIILIVASFNIISSLIMLVHAKRGDIAVLRTMGASRASLMRIFMTVGTAIGTVGVAAGLVLSFLFITWRESVVKLIGLITGENVWDPSMRYLTELPAKTDPWQTAGIVALALLFSFLATIYPAFKAARTDPVQVLRYE